MLALKSPRLRGPIALFVDKLCIVCASSLSHRLFLTGFFTVCRILIFIGGHSQMGSRMKKSVFDDQTSKALKNWHMLVKKRHAKGGKTPSRTLGSVSPSVSSVSSAHALQRFKTTGHSTRSSYTFDDQDESDLEAEASSPTTATTSFIVRVDDDDDDVTEVDVPRQEEETRNEDDFSFAKPAPPKKP